MRKYRIEATKNGVTQSTLVHTDLDFSAVHQKLWHAFSNDDMFYWGDLMVREPDFARVVEIGNEAVSQRKVNAS